MLLLSFQFTLYQIIFLIIIISLHYYIPDYSILTRTTLLEQHLIIPHNVLVIPQNEHVLLNVTFVILITYWGRQPLVGITYRQTIIVPIYVRFVQIKRHKSNFFYWYFQAKRVGLHGQLGLQSWGSFSYSKGVLYWRICLQTFPRAGGKKYFKNISP